MNEDDKRKPAEDADMTEVHAASEAHAESEARAGVEDPHAVEVEFPSEAGANELASCIGRLQRLQAEFENYKKRSAKDATAIEERAEDRVLLEFLTPYENLERAFVSYASDQNAESFVAGVEQIFSQFSRILEQRNVERIPALGTPFDPALHEALLTAPSDEDKNTIIEEFSPGYRRNGRVLRASRVAVSQGPAAQEEQE
jgi:molecular chaperone GrpE